MSTGHDLDPEIRQFIGQVSAAYASFPAFAEMTPVRAREVAEQVRAPWRQGGPEMVRTTERVVPCDHGDVRVRLYYPSASTAPQPALIYVHGGGWAIFSIDTHDRVMREYAARAGMVVIGVDYALSPEAKFPTALEQVAAVVRWAHKEAAALGIDPARLAIGGDSAGGNLSIATALKLRDEGRGDLLRGMLLLYAAFQRECSDDAAHRYGGPAYMLTREEIGVFWSRYLRDPKEASNPLASPALARLEGLPPVHLTIPECDVLTEQSLAMIDRLRAAGVPVDFKLYAGATHSFLEAVSVARVADRALDDGAAWLKAQTA